MTLAWWQRGIVYQIYPRSFNDSNGDGVGDLQGIIDKLDYLNDGTPNSLGIDAIWISPFYPSPMADFGYDVADYTGVDPIFGDLDTFDKLVAEAHKRDIKVIVDFVPNHSSDQHEWFKESRSSRDNPKRDWYIWRDAQPDGSPPNNWGSVFGGTTWEWDEATQQYYFHQFVKEQPDLNWRNPDVRAAMYDVLRFWMRRGVDGFRMDVIYMIWKHPDMPDQPFIEGAQGRGEDDIYGRQEHLYAYDYDGIHDIMKEIRGVLDEFPDRVMIGEIWLPLEDRMTYHGENLDEFHMPFNFDFIADGDILNRKYWQAATFRQAVEAYEAALPAGGWPNYVLGNHDIERMVTRLGSEGRARVGAMLLLTLRGTPTLYHGDEIGLPNGVIAAEQIQDPQGLRFGVAHTRDVARTPMQWDDSAHAGFSTVEPWLPLSADYTTRNVAAQADDPRSFLSLYRRLIWYRKAHESLVVGTYETLAAPDAVFAYLRTHADERHLIALNFSEDEQAVELPAEGTIVLSTYMDRTDQVRDTLTLRASEGLIVRLRG